MPDTNCWGGILIIEDDPAVADSISCFVQSLGYKIAGIAHSRTEALALAAQNPPALILSDLHLQARGCGAAAVEAISATQPVPVAFITGNPEAVPRTPRLKEATVMAKPFDPRDLARFLAAALPLPEAT